MNICYTIGKNAFLLFFKLFYRHKAYFLHRLPQGSCLIVANHDSFFDPPLVGTVIPQDVHFLARDSLFRIPVFGWLIRKTNAHPIAQGASDLSTLKAVISLLKEGKKVVIFPEGTRSWDGRLGPIKPGVSMIAMKAKVPIVPVYIAGSFEVWSRHRKFPRLKGRTACVFGEPIEVEKYSAMDRKEAQAEIALKTRQALLELQKWSEKGAQ